MKRFLKPFLTPICSIVVVLLSSQCSHKPSLRPLPSVGASTSGLPGEAAALEAVNHRQDKSLSPARLAKGLVPPTDRRFSGMVFDSEPLSVYPPSLSFQLEATGFDFRLPEVKSTEKTLFGGHRPEVAVTLPGVEGWQMVTYDAVTVVAEARNSSEPVSHVTLAQGSPRIAFAALKSMILETSPLPDHFALTPDPGSDASQLQLTEGQAATWAAVPDGMSKTDLLDKIHPVASSKASWQIDDEKTSTTIRWHTTDRAPILMATVPHQATDTAQECQMGTYESIYGKLRLCLTSSVTWSTLKQLTPANYGLGGLDETARMKPTTHFEADVRDLPAYPANAYFAGRVMARDAQLIHLAKALGRDDLATEVYDRLVPELKTWLSPTRCADSKTDRCFFYDQTNHDMVGLMSIFGSDEFNGHHFHYGYFLHAAALAVMNDPSLLPGLSPVATLLASNIAHPTASDSFPAMRVYDVYISHSWTSGTSPFAGANNRESTSEVVAAWMELRLWTETSGDQALADQATWMQSSKTDAALRYWLSFNVNDPLCTPLKYNYLPPNFGGRRDFATWFSPDPEAGLVIQVLPVIPASTYLGVDRARVATNVDEALTASTFNRTYEDLLLAYWTLSGPEARKRAIELADTIPIDDGFSRSLLLTWLYALKEWSSKTHQDGRMQW